MADPIVHEIRRFEQLDSTNDYALRNAQQLTSGTVVMAGFQSEGKGTQGRIWTSDADKNLLFSLYYKDEAFSSLPLFSLRIALGLAIVLKGYGPSPMIKWPNDIIVEGQKIAGILIEMQAEHCVVGIGLNVNQQVFPTDLHRHATSLFNQLGKATEPVGVLLKVLDALDDVLTWDDTKVLSKYRSLLYQKGMECRVNINGDKFTATLTDIDDNGVLIVTDRQNRMIKIHSKAMLVE
jgi:BirA family biotin operon repressor/biotin-[acetyl-CoA-carboxylase] ligase